MAEQRWLLKSQGSRENSFLLLPSPSIWFKKCSLPPCPLPVMDAPRLCLQQKVKPPGFARRLPESPTDFPLPGQGIFNLFFFCFSGAAGGRAGCGSGATWWSHPGLRHSQLHPHSHLGVHPPGDQVRRAKKSVALGGDASSLRL